jgi:hypothetical protein
MSNETQNPNRSGSGQQSQGGSDYDKQKNQQSQEAQNRAVRSRAARAAI